MSRRYLLEQNADAAVVPESTECFEGLTSGQKAMRRMPGT